MHGHPYYASLCAHMAITLQRFRCKSRACLFESIFDGNCKCWEFLTLVSDNVFGAFGILHFNARFLKTISRKVTFGLLNS